MGKPSIPVRAGRSRPHGKPSPGRRWAPGKVQGPAVRPGEGCYCSDWTPAKGAQMADQQEAPTGPDLTQGIPAGDVVDGGMLVGHVGDEAVLLARRGDEWFAIGAKCSHYSGPLVEGLLVGDTVRCP